MCIPGRWTGPRHRRAGGGEPGMEARPGGPRDGAGRSAGHLPFRAPPGRCPRAAHHDGASRAHAPGRSHRGAARHRVRAAQHGRAASTIRRDDGRSRHPLRPGRGTRLLGRRMPDLDLVTADGPLRVFTLLHDARPVLLNLGEPGGFDIAPWADRVRSIDAEYVGKWELPAFGEVTAPTAVLIRPEGYVAWVGDGTDLGLPDALSTWFGPPTAA